MRLFARLFALLAAIIAMPVLAQNNYVPLPQGMGRPAPPATTDKEDLLLLDLSTGGRVTIWLRPDVAPKTVERIKLLTRQHFYDGLKFHRVIEGFMAQTGDPKGDGTGGSTLPDLKAEFNYLPHVRGAVSAARAESEDSANSQFFIVFQPKLSLDKKYTVFGRVLSGMEYVDAIERGEPPAHPSMILHAYIGSDNPPAYQPPAPVAAPPVEAPVVLPPKAPAAPAKAPTAPAPAPAGKPAPKKK